MSRPENPCPYARQLEAALMDLYNNIGGHNHWDREGNAGRTCLICIRQREAQARVRKIVHAIPPELYGVPLS